MWLSRFFSLALLCSAAAGAQTLTSVQVASPQDVLVCGQAVALQAWAYDQYGATWDGFTPRWRSLSESTATVDSAGNVQALRPGVVAIEAADPDSGLSGIYSLTIVPLRVDITPAHPIMRVGDTLKLAAAAIDINGKAIDGVAFRWISGIGGIAKVAADGTVSALRTGSLTVSAAVQSASGPLSFTSSAIVDVYRKPDYTVTPLLSSADSSAAAMLVAPSAISAAGDSLLAFIGDLSNGAQALAISENGAPRVLAVTGQVLGANSKVINRFTGVSVNRGGDVIATLQFPAEYCDTALVLFQRGKPETVLDTACNITITDRALNDKGAAVYYVNDNGQRFFLRDSTGLRTRIAQNGDTIGTGVTVSSLGRAFLTSAGAAILEVYPSSGSETLYRWDGAFHAMGGIGSTIDGVKVNGMDLAAEGDNGDIYCRFNFSDGNPRAVRYSGGTWTTVVQANTVNSGTRIYWIYRAAPAAGGGVAFVSDSDKGTGLFRAKLSSLERLSALPSGNDVTQLVPGSSSLFAVGSFGATSLGVYKLTGDGTATPLVSTPLPLPAGPPSILWDSMPERGVSSTPLLRLPGNSLGRVSKGSVQFLAGTSTPLGKLAVTVLGNAVTAPDGSAILSAMTPTGPMLLNAHGGKLDIVADTQTKKLAGNSQNLTWYDYGASPYAVNASGQFVATASTNNATYIWRFDFSSGSDVRPIIQYNAASPAGPAYNYVGRAAIDASGRVAFIANLADGSQGLFLWENNAVRKLLRTGETGLAQTQTITGVSNVQFAGTRVVARIGYQSTTILQSYDGTAWTPVVSQGDVLSFGRTVDSFAGPETIANAAGDIAYVARSSSYVMLLVRTHDGRDVMVASTAEPLSDGSWPLFFDSFSITAQGDLLFVAESSQGGKSVMTLYRATAAN